MVHRIAVVDQDLCQTKKCGLECIKECPVNINGQECIVLGGDKIALISEELCIGCGVCAYKCQSQSLSLIRREVDHHPPKTVRDWAVEFITTRKPA